MSFHRADFYDAELRRHHGHFRAALDIAPGDRVLDIGCGAGQSTRDAARAASDGSVLGVDVSEELLQVARERTAQDGLRNIAFELGDAQTHAFPGAHFDLCISRFGTMFFADPVAAFANIGRSLRPGARLVLMLWQARERNEWATAIQDALAPGSAPAAAAAFSLADPAVATDLLKATGFASITFTDVHEPVFYGPTVDAAYEAVVGLFVGKDAPAGADTDKTLQRLHALVEAHLAQDGVWFDSRAWIVTAHKAA
ncbi:class I SAM-dependent methyltransferase [Dyella marensis]|uniref:Methyltransferase domain-containing protein n=1 Tax=Dyella marensis TaxID=500610 RepID=A0A1I1WTN3_9GAMM|nr:MULTISPECIES: class I SAM-dependent methyltransferase [Dyella]SFD98382.1 Methyltransferase domain-containing protein [Dyella marensis]